jgi:YcxB-like protein
MTPDQKPPVIEESQRVAIKYSLTRWDLLRWNIYLVNRNRTIWVMLIGLNSLITFQNLNAPEMAERTLVVTILFVIVWFALMTAIVWSVTVLSLALPVAFKKHKGLLGEHELEIQQEGLVERTAFNEAIHRWAGFHKVVRTRGYLIIYVTDNTAHIVPRRCFPSDHELNHFESALRRHLPFSKG